MTQPVAARPARPTVSARVAPPPVPVRKPASAPTRPMAAVAAPRIEVSLGSTIGDTTAEWPKTEPVSNIHINYPDTHPDTQVEPPREREVIELVKKRAETESPSTVIPVPKLPRRTETMRIEPVVRPSTTAVAGAPRRFPKGTRPVTGSVGVAPPPPIRPAEDDRTKPGIAIPPAARTVALPSIKQRMATRG
ncbi:MAG TPA: hypothetical protein VFQ53_10825 [Kofleriaceae bacterium]|nr:hypothetical protein [Kofleriaceae bacterium]